MKYKALFIILTIFFFNQSFALENKILFKVNNEIITSLDIIEEIKYLKVINKQLRNIEKKELYEIAKNSLIKEKIKEIEISKNFKNFEVDENVVNKILIEAIRKEEINTFDKALNYLNNKELNSETVISKIKIEMLWNQLIVMKFSKNLKVSKETVKKELSNKSNQKEFLLSEIVFDLKQGENLDLKFELIKNIINKKNFSQAAVIYSISSTSNSGGELGWIKETAIENRIRQVVSNTLIGNITKPIKIPSGFLILKKNDERIVAKNINIEKETKQIVNEIKNYQLNQFSNIYFNKLRKNISINEL